MKRIILFSLTLTCFLNGFGQVSINTNHLPPDSSAMLDISSNNKGLLTPRLTTTARLAIAKPATGLLVFDLNYKCFFLYDGFKWMAIAAVDPSEIQSGSQSPGDIVSNNQFGYSTGIDSLYAIVGAPFQNDSVGAAYIYKKNNNEWVQMGKIVPDTNCLQLFGKSVSIEYPYAVVGAPSYTGNKGAVYIFHCDGVAWTQTNKLQKTNVIFERPQFGFSVDIDYPIIVTGAPTANTVAMGGGAAYTYKRLKTGWTYQSTLTDTSIKAGDNFGFSVAVNDSFIVAGAPNHSVDTVVNQGLAYQFIQNPDATWTLADVLKPFWLIRYYNDGWTSKPDISYNWVYKKFGYSVDIKCNRSVINGTARKTVFTAIGAPESFFNFNTTQTSPNLGLIDIFTSNDIRSNDRTLVLSQKDEPDLYDSNDKFGYSVSLSEFTGNPQDTSMTMDLHLLSGCPTSNKGIGKINMYKIEKNLSKMKTLSNGQLIYWMTWDYNYKYTFETSYSPKAVNAAAGFSCSMFDSNSYITGLPGLNLNQGGIIFKF